MKRLGIWTECVGFYMGRLLMRSNRLFVKLALFAGCAIMSPL